MAKSSSKTSAKTNGKPTKYISEELVRDSSPSSASSASESEEVTSTNKVSSEIHPVSFEYKPPQGYNAVNSTFDSPFSDEKLAGKQVFHITAPSSIHLLRNGRALKMNPSQNGSTFMLESDKDVSYIVRKTSGADAGNLDMFVPLRGKAGYKLSKTPIIAHYTITEAPPTQELTLNNSHTKVVKSRRTQPEGLKMRFKPAGWGSDSDEEPIINGSNSHIQNGVEEDDDVDMLETKEVPTTEPPKKKHKSKQPPVFQPDEDMDIIEQEQLPTGSYSKVVVPEKRDDETKEERQLRRELKRKDKEEKRRRKGKV